MSKNKIITVQGIPVTVSYEDIDDYICITDIAAAKSDNSRAADVIKNWMRNRSTLEFLRTWEQIYNPNFKVVEFDHFKQEGGFTVAPLCRRSGFIKCCFVWLYSYAFIFY